MNLPTRLFSFVLALFIVIPLFADEGMWMPHQMKDLNLAEKGLKMEPSQLYKTNGTGLMSAVVHLGGGTGEFVSSQGLILTNHHVAFGALQRASTPEKDYLENGFIAWNKSEEIPALGYHADVLLSYQDVTAKFESALQNAKTAEERYKTIDKLKKELIAETEKSGADIRAQVASMYSGNQYYLYKFKRIKDLRLVFAPPRSLGNFGGDIDNWMWPRHTADFSFLRAYVTPDGIGAEFDAGNVPYHPNSYLKISKDGVDKGDFTFVMGYPGRTFRNYTVTEFQEAVGSMKGRLELLKKMVTFFEDAGSANREIQIKYASLVRGLNNVIKNSQGKLAGFEQHDIMKKKEDSQQRLAEWISGNPQRSEKYDGVFEKTAAADQNLETHQRSVKRLENLVNPYYGSMLLNQAYTIYRAVKERQKPDMEREERYQERNIPALKERIRLAERRYDFKTDQAFFAFMLENMAGFPADEVPEILKEIVENKTTAELEQFAGSLYSKTVLADPETRLSLLDQTPQDLEKLNDPLLDFAMKIGQSLEDQEETGKILEQSKEDAKKEYLGALLEFKNGKLAPDANSTIRFTYGKVKGYSPRDAVLYLPQTTLSGVIEKDTGEFPFDVPDKLKQLAAADDFGQYEDQELGDVPACFLNTTNVTGGSSGSPTLNDRGEQVGIIFDMTYESVIGDYYIIPELQRTISVDLKYVLFVTDKFSGAKHIIKELGM